MAVVFRAYTWRTKLTQSSRPHSLGEGLPQELLEVTASMISRGLGRRAWVMRCWSDMPCASLDLVNGTLTTACLPALWRGQGPE